MCASQNLVSKNVKPLDVESNSGAKRPRLDDKRSAKTNENPDVVYAMNFIEKVEETVANEDEFGRFLKILNEFDSVKDKVADLYFVRLHTNLHIKFLLKLIYFITET